MRTLLLVHEETLTTEQLKKKSLSSVTVDIHSKTQSSLALINSCCHQKWTPKKITKRKQDKKKSVIQAAQR